MRILAESEAPRLGDRDRRHEAEQQEQAQNEQPGGSDRGGEGGR
jgi:hypothetical protein